MCKNVVKFMGQTRRREADRAHRRLRNTAAAPADVELDFGQPGGSLALVLRANERGGCGGYLGANGVLIRGVTLPN